MKKLKTVAAIGLMCIWVFASAITVQIVMSWLMLWLLGREAATQPVWIAVYSALSYLITLALIIFVPMRWVKISRNDLGLRGWPTWTDIGLAPVGFIVAMILAAGLVVLFSAFPWFNADEAQKIGFSVYVSGGDRIIAFITLVVITPIAEEIIFRGWLYGKVRGKLSKMPEWAGIIISTLVVSVLFGLIHMQWNVGVNVFCLSVVMCGLREVTGTIYSGILAHMIKNGVAFYLVYVLGS